jgi:hypothetical protein
VGRRERDPSSDRGLPAASDHHGLIVTKRAPHRAGL